ncbi:MAG: hypothetical protein GXO75_05965 [Calditrichaeota bacterium]|nr:hypothetical protein [Calditrichota bacterium]
MENKAAISSINHNFTNNIRHALEHLSIATTLALDDLNKEKSINHINEAIIHLQNLAPDSCEHIAGKKLKESRIFMAGSGIFAEIRKSQELHEQAIFHYTQGRNIRSADPDQAIKRFNDVVDLCNNAIQLITPARKIQKAQIIIAFLGWLIAFILFLDKVFSIF